MLHSLSMDCLTDSDTRAKVDNAATAQPNGLRWFKVAEDGLDSSGKWAVDRLIASGGWMDFTMPTCVAPGNYLLRAEIIALHSASVQGAAQFYMVSSFLYPISKEYQRSVFMDDEDMANNT